MAKIHLTKKLNGSFWPTEEEDREKTKRIKAGETIEVDFKKPRNYKFLQKYMALIKIVFENLPEVMQPYFATPDDLRKDIAIESGYYETKYTYKGDSYKVAKSVSFAAMDEIEFEQFYNATITTILQSYLIGTDENELRKSAAEKIAVNF